MKYKTNKEIIDALEAYFLKQDPKAVCRSLAASLIDLNRLVNLEKMDKEERECLYARTRANYEELHRFLRDGDDGEKFRLHNCQKPEQVEEISAKRNKKGI